MKKTKSAFILSVCIAACSACSHDQYEWVDFTKLNQTKSTGFTVTREYDSDVLTDIPWDRLESGGQEEGGQTKATYTNLIGTISNIVSSLMSSTIHEVAGTYRSVDIYGDSLTVSGKIMYPKQGTIKNIMVVSHYTIGSNAECPSESFSFEGIYAALGYAVVIADYIGFGVTKDMIHPYLQAKTTAHNVIDFALVARPFLESRGLVPADDSIILLGYSQGGATTLHVQRMLETEPEYIGRFNVKKNYCGSGPYNIAKTYDYAIKKDMTGIPCAIPMIVQGMSIGMNVPLDMKYFFKEPLYSHYDDWLNSKKYTVSQISDLIGSSQVSDILTSNARDKSKAETQRFYKELIENSIPDDYMPQTPLYMFHSEDDQTVPFINSQLMQKNFRYCDVDIEYDFDHYGNHQQGASKFILKVLNILNQQ